MSDAIAVLTLLGTALLIALPILTGGYRTYMDHPVHLAEIAELAKGAEWSELGFTGYPLGTFHSPLWYGLLAALERWGIGATAPYVALVVLGFAAPAVAVYGVARRRMRASLACALAYVVLIQPPLIWGIGAALGGMWTHTLAAGLVVALADLLCRPSLSPLRHVWASALLALVAMTHLFALLIAVLVIAISTWQLSQSLDRREVGARLVGWLVASIASAGYWLTFALTSSPAAAGKDIMGVVELLARLVVPTDAMMLLAGRAHEAVSTELYLTDAIPMIALIVLGVVGRFRDSNGDPLARTGFLLALVVLLGVGLEPYYEIALLGPVSWRLLLWVRIGLALSAIPLLAQLKLPHFERVGRRGFALAAAAAVGLGLWWGKPLRADARPLDAELAEAETLWNWLAENKEDGWGRVYLQDTFGYPWLEGGAARSHLLVYTRQKTGLAQLGTYYGIVPFGTRWTLGEFGSLYTRKHWGQTWLLAAMRDTNAGVLITSNPRARYRVDNMTDFEPIFETGRYTVWRPQGLEVDWVLGLRPSNRITNVRRTDDSFELDLSTEFPRGRILFKTTYHKWWRTSGIPGAHTRESPVGHLVVDGIPKGKFRLRVWYEPNRIPIYLGWAGWALIAGAGLYFWRRGRKDDARSATK